MNLKSKQMWILVGIGIASFVSALVFSGKGLMTSLFATPGVAAMVGLVVFIVRDDAAHRRNIELQEKQQYFELGAAQHMASVTFDKHVLFCEEYLKVLLDGLRANDGLMPKKEMINLSVLMWEVRKKYVAWLTSELDMELGNIENGIRSMGIDAHRLDYLPIGAERSTLVDNIIQNFAKFIGAKEPEEKDLAIFNIIEQIRRILGVQELALIRKKVISAVTNTKEEQGC